MIFPLGESARSCAIVKKMVCRPQHPAASVTPYSPDLIPVGFFLFQRVKEELAGLSLEKNSFKKTWEWVLRTIPTDEIATDSR
jgi:hypothetical protein